jgi:hypothetical protein
MRHLTQMDNPFAQMRGKIPALVMVGGPTAMCIDFQVPSQLHAPVDVDLHVLSRRPIDAPER